MYQSPIEITRTVDDIVTKINEKQDETIVHACMRVGVNVDKDELLKALNYDRHQYEKGYADGRRARDSEIVRCADCKHWVTVIDHKKAEYGLCDVIKVVGTTPKDGFCYKGERIDDENI